MGSRYGLVSGSLRGFGSLKIAPHFCDFIQTNSWQVHTPAFNGFGRLLMTDPRENVELKPRCLNRYVWGQVLSTQTTLHTDITTAMQSGTEWGSHVTAGWSCDYLTHAQISTAAMMCLFCKFAETIIADHAIYSVG